MLAFCYHGRAMSQILIRNLEPETVHSLKELAKVHKRSLQAEAKLILEEAANRAIVEADRLAERERRLRELIRFADEMAEASGPQSIDSVDLIREDRDR